MGNYLAQPITTKETSSGSCDTHAWGSSCMQGWRTGMEDAHITISHLQGIQASGGDWSESEAHLDLALFSVFDGHGGGEVAEFCHQHVPGEVLRRLGEKSSSDPRALGQALTETYHRIDELLRLPEHQKQLTAMNSAKAKGGEGEGGTKAKLSAGMLADSIKNDLRKAAVTGQLSDQVLLQAMAKRALLEKLEAAQGLQAQRGKPGGNLANSMGCTANSILLSDTHVVCANTGDSRAVLCREGRAVALSKDHKPNDDKEKRRIELAGGYIVSSPQAKSFSTGHSDKQPVMYRVNGNLNLSRCIGDLDYKQRSDLGPEKQIISSTPDICVQELHSEDEFIVLACDGVWDVKTNQEVCDYVRRGLSKGKDIPEIVEALLDECITPDPKKTRGLGADNMTCIVVVLSHSARTSRTSSGRTGPTTAARMRNWLCGMCPKTLP